MLDAQTCRQNALLAGLPGEDRARISPYLEAVTLSRGEVVHESHFAPRYAYFPIDCVVSLQYMLRDGACDELAMIGNEGMVGVALLMGGSPASRAVVRRSGYAWRINAGFLRAEFRRVPTLQRGTLCYCQGLMTQIAQTAVCNRHHTVEQQLCRWMLLSLDRLPSNELRFTQEQISNMLGVRREGITEAAGRLQRAGAIHYSRGRIEVLDRTKLESAACECYDVIRRECARLRPHAFDELPIPATAHRHPQPAMAAAADRHGCVPSNRLPRGHGSADGSGMLHQLAALQREHPHRADLELDPHERHLG